MKKIIKSTDVPGGNVSSHLFAKIQKINLEPEIDTTDRAWTFHDVLQTDTACVPWLISVDGEYFAAIQSPPAARSSHQVSFYPSTKRGKYRISLNTMVERLPFYMDLEAACDEFSQIMYKRKIEEEKIDDEMKILEELHDIQDTTDNIKE